MNNETNEAPKHPAARPEITAEIIALDCHLADLFLKCQGNARELDELAGMLDAHLACYEEARDELLGFNTEQLAPFDMTDLPADQQRLILESAVFGGLTLQTLQKLTDKDVVFLMQQVSEGVETITGKMSDEQVRESLRNYLENHQQNTAKLVFCSSIQVCDSN